MKTTLLYVALVTGLLVIFPASTTQAHILKLDHGISAVLHIPPDDMPQAGEVTKLDIAYGDIHDSFSLQDCDCQVHIKKDEKVIQSTTPQPALPGATLNSDISVTFPDGGDYEVAVDGSARDGAFPDFELEFPVRVKPVPVTSIPARNVAASLSFIGLGGAIMMSSIIALVVRRPRA
jgi:hypothetical protein